MSEILDLQTKYQNEALNLIAKGQESAIEILATAVEAIEGVLPHIDVVEEVHSTLATATDNGFSFASSALDATRKFVAKVFSTVAPLVAEKTESPVKAAA